MTGDTIDATGISGVITLTSGQLLVDKSVTINGAGADLLAVDGNATSRVFQTVTGAKTVSISGLTIRNGQLGKGGGIENADTVTLTIINSTLSGNKAGLGGGVFISGTVTIINSTFSSNMASEGGGIYNSGSGTLTITNSTFSGNAAPVEGGASFNLGTMQIANTTLSDNSSPLGGGFFNMGTLQIGNTILNAGASGANITNNGGTVTSHGYNLSNDDGAGFLNGPGDQINTNPLLGPLQDNGGHTFTHELLNGSPAIDAGDPSFTPPPFNDQRGSGFNRVRNGRIDIGSFEVQFGPTPTVIIVTNTNDNGPGSLRQALAVANDGDTIDASGISGVITLTSGELLVAKSVTINGPSADLLAIDGNAASRVFEIGSGETVMIFNLTIRNGRDDVSGGGILNGDGATSTITNCTVSGNLAGGIQGQGGGIFNAGTLTIANSTVSGNTAGSAGGVLGDGGGICNRGTLTIVNNTISGNMAISKVGSGGGLFNDGTLAIVNSTISGNMASKGGGIDNAETDTTVTITNSTFSGNTVSANWRRRFNQGHTADR